MIRLKFGFGDDDVEWIQQAQSRIKWQSFLNRVAHTQVLYQISWYDEQYLLSLIVLQ
jgi:hypothetical protein